MQLATTNSYIQTYIMYVKYESILQILFEQKVRSLSDNSSL